MKNRRPIAIITVLVMLLTLLTGCSKADKEQVFLTTGFSEDEVFILKDVDHNISKTCTLPEAYVYLANTKNKYEDVYGEGIWGTSVDGISMPENIKDNVIFELSQIKAMNILARISEIELTEEEDKLVNEATNSYYSSLSSEEAAKINVNRDVIYGMYREYALAEKLYKSRIADINPEISDDEATWIDCTDLVRQNTPKKIDFYLPPAATDGSSYRIVIKSTYVNGKTRRKAPAYTYSDVVTVTAV